MFCKFGISKSNHIFTIFLLPNVNNLHNEKLKPLELINVNLGRSILNHFVLYYIYLS